MTEFAGSTPVGGIFVTVSIDEASKRRAFQQFKKELAQLEKDARMRVGAGGGGGGGSPTDRSRQFAPTVGSVYSSSWTTGGGGGDNGPARQRAAAGRPGSRMENDVRTGAMAITASAIARTAEAIMDFTTTAIAATRNLKVAVNDSQRIAAMVGGRQGFESAAEKIPIAGGLGVSFRRLMDSASGESVDDIARQQAETQRINQLYANTVGGFWSNRQRTAGARAGMFSGGSFEMDRMVIDAQTKYKQYELSNKRSTTGEKYQGLTGEQMFYDENGGQSPLSKLAWQTKLGFEKRQWDEKAAARNREIDAEKGMEKKTLDAEGRAIEIESKASKEKLSIAEDSLRMQLQFREKIAIAESKWQFVAADTMDRVLRFAVGFKSTPVEFQQQYAKTALAEAIAEKSNYMTEVGRYETGAIDPGRDLTNDPAGIRHLTDPMEAMNANIAAILSLMQAAGLAGR